MAYDIQKDLDSLNKFLYLENPDLWMEFKSKEYNENNTDELLLFIASKFNYIDVVKFVISNNLIDLYSQSENKEFNTIYNHLLYVSKHHNNTEIYNYLISISKYAQSDENIDTTDTYIPTRNCPHCNANLFEVGCVAKKEKVYKYSSNTGNLDEFENNSHENLYCNSCNNELKGLTLEKLNSSWDINLCNECSSDIRVTGISCENSMTFDKALNKFIPSQNNFTCSNCNALISEDQKQYFKLK